MSAQNSSAGRRAGLTLNAPGPARLLSAYAALKRSFFPLMLLFILAASSPGLGRAQAPAADPPAAASGLAPQGNAPNDVPIPVVNEIFNEWTLNNGLLYWANRCLGGEFAGPSTLKRLPVNGGLRRTLEVTDTDHCVTFLNMAADSSGLYYYSAGFSRLEAHRSGTPTVATPIFNLTAAQAPVGDRLSLDGGFIYWLTSSQLLRVRKNGTGFSTVVASVTGGDDLVVVGGAVYWLDDGGLWRTNVLCGALPCPKENISANQGRHLLFFRQGGPIATAGPRLVFDVGTSLHRVSCSDITIFCNETTPYTVPPDGNPWVLGRAATDGVNLFWEESYPSDPADRAGRLRRMPINGTTPDVVDIASNLFPETGPVYIDTGFVYFFSADINGIQQILKLPLNATALVRDLTADAFEVTQTIQNLANDVPIVSHKPTFVRAFSLETAGPDALAVDAILVGTRAGNPLPGSPLHPINGRITTKAGLTYVRDTRDSGWLFRIPDSWTDTGTVIMKLVVDPGSTYADPNRLNNELTRTVVFQTREIMCNVFIPIETHAPLPSVNVPNFGQMIDYATRLWPTSRFRSYHNDTEISELEICTWHHIPYPCFGPYEMPDDTWKVFINLETRSILTNNPDECDSPNGNTHFIGMVSSQTDTGTTTGTGMTAVFDIAWVKFSDDIAAADDPFAPESGETLAHEVAHNNDREHVDCGGPDDPDTSYPYPTNQLDNLGNANHYGFDVKSLKVIPPGSAADLMTYCPPKWSSDYTYDALFASLAPGNAPIPAGPATPDLAAASGVVLVSGAVTPTASTGELGYAWNLPQAALNPGLLSKLQQISQANAASAGAPGSPAADYHIRLLDASGAVLADQPVTPGAGIREAPSTIQPFVAAFPAPAGTVARLELLQGSTVIDSRTPGPSVPAVTLTQPAGGTIAGPLPVTVQGIDPDRGDTLLYSVQYSPDSGASWISIATDLAALPGSNTLSLSLPARGLPGSAAGGARIRVAASDGFNTGLAVSAPFTVPDRPPEPFILTPAQNDTFPAGQDVPLRGQAMDAEDGDVSGAGLTWTVGGQPAGSGEQNSAPGLAPGSYPVVLTAQDSTGQKATAGATLTILPLSIPTSSTPTLDGYCDDPGYANGSQVLLKPYTSGDQAAVRLLRDNAALYACFTGLAKGAEVPGAMAGLRIDADHSQDPLAQTTDLGFFAGEDGSVVTLAGDGAGGFSPVDPGSLDARITASDNTWTAELRIDAAAIGGLDHIVGLALGHYNVAAGGDDYAWPYASDPAGPATWADTALAALPAIEKLSPASATVGGPDLDLVITGTNFVPASQVLFNGTLLSPTVGSSTILTVTVPASELDAAGLLPVLVRNPGGIDSGPETFTLRNPQPAVTSLSPGSAQALGPAFALQVNGSGFVSGAKVLWNGEELPTAFSSSGRLTAQVEAGRILSGGVAEVSVLNPGPEAQASPAVPFFINTTFNEFLPFMTGTAAPQ